MRTRLLCLLPALGLPCAGSVIQQHPPATIFAASCATCHGADGSGGRSFINNVGAPDLTGLAGITLAQAKAYVRDGSNNGGMPGFGPEEITDTELDALVAWLRFTCAWSGCPPPAVPPGTQVRVDLLDADPFYSDRGADAAADPFDDARRVVLAPGQYVRLVNTGKTWHTMTNHDEGIDSGFIGPAGNLGAGTGYYDADQSTGLAQGCFRYLCKLHPYMQFEVCAAGAQPGALTTASRRPLPPPAIGGRAGEELWVLTQSQHQGSFDMLDGAAQVFDAATWARTAFLPHVGNNPHNGWVGLDANGVPSLVVGNWHGNSVTLLDPVTKQLLPSHNVGAVASHVQVSPGPTERWFVTIMGGRAVQEIDPARLRVGSNPSIGPPLRGQTSPHGIWFLADGDHFVTANTLAGSVSLYSASQGAELSFAPTGGRGPFASSVFQGGMLLGLSRAYCNNAEDASVSLFDISTAAGTITHNTTSIPAALRDAAGNLKLRDTTLTPVRWASLPIQTPVSPPGATTHGRFMVSANKASFNVSVTALSSLGIPTAVYTFPAGLGAHGAAFGRKGLCDSGNTADVCYYAYVTNTFQDYVSVYDLERIATAGAPGSATEMVSVEGHGATVLCGTGACDVPITTFCPDCRSGVLVGDVPLKKTTLGRRTYLKEEMWLGPLGAPVMLDLSLGSDTGAQGVLVSPSPAPWP